jgi:predicted nucleic acid-binding protein
MAERWVVNASPLIVLAKINQQQLIWQLADEVIVPEAVRTEIAAGPADDPARNYLEEAALPVVSVASQSLIAAWDLGAGESDVLAYALNNPGWRAVIDDGAARRCARTFTIPLIGTLGIIIRACKTGLIPAAAPLLLELKNHNFHIDDQVIRPALLKILGESWPP